MTAPTWADRSLPLAERVLEAIRDAGLHGFQGGRLAELLMDVAVADRLARCRCAALEADDAWETMSGEGPEDSVALWDALVVAEEKERAALAAYRARMAQGVTHG